MTKAFLRDGNVLHARIPSLPSSLPGAPSGAAKYVGDTARGYDAKREDSEKWKREDEIIRAWLTELAPKSVLDVPVGTGRFLPLYAELGVEHILGLDISPDMLQAASAKVAHGGGWAGAVPYLRIGDARDLGEIGKFEVAICCRLMRWLETNEMQLKVISELMRVATRAVIFNVRIETGPLPLAEETIFSHAINAGWGGKITKETIVEDFTMFRLEPQ